MDSKEEFLEKSKCYKDMVDSSFLKEQTLLGSLDEDSTPQDIAVTYFSIAREKIYQSSLNVVINNIALKFTSSQDKTCLNDARRLCFEALDCLEKISSKYLDVPYTEYEDKILAMQDITISEKLKIFKKLGFLIDHVKYTFGDNSKWKWIFVDAEGRFVTVMKNFLNLKEIVTALSNPSYPMYRDWMVYNQILKSELVSTSDKYKQKYEVFSKKPEDFGMAINYLIALKKYLILTNDTRDLENLSRKIEIWKSNFDKYLAKLKKEK